MEPASPALAGGFFTTEPPGKPNLTVLRDPVAMGPVEEEKKGKRLRPEHLGEDSAAGGSKRPASRLERRAEALASPRDEA